jgi:hypothetical protein
VPAVRVQTRNRVECAVIGLSEDRDAVAENLHGALASAAVVHCRRGCRYLPVTTPTSFELQGPRRERLYATDQTLSATF